MYSKIISIAVRTTSILIAIVGYFLHDAESFNYRHSPRSSFPTSRSASVNEADQSSSKIAFPELQKCIIKEYATFFNPMEKRFYEDDVTFIDPMTSFTGIAKYQGNVDMLAGRTLLGKTMFEDASIVLHKIEQLSPNQLQTRWTLQITAKLLPWKPRAYFTGISVYTISDKGKVKKQEDYWDSVNLINGQYRTAPFQEGLADFASQLKKEDGAAMSAPELPVSNTLIIDH